MYLKINTDHARFRQIIRGRIKKDLRKYISKGEMIGRKGKHLVSIPLRLIFLISNLVTIKARALGLEMAQRDSLSGPEIVTEVPDKLGICRGSMYKK